MKKFALLFALGVSPAILSFADSSLNFLEEEVASEVVEANQSMPMPSNQMAPSKDMRGPSMLRDCWPPEDKHWIAGISLLVWQLDEAGLDYAVSKDEPVAVFSGNAADGLFDDMHFGKFEWSPGFRLNGGYKFRGTPWIVEGEYTWYHNDNSNHAKRGSDSFEVQSGQGDPTAYIFSLNPTADCAINNNNLLFKAQIHESFNYNVLDVTFQRNIAWVERINATPFFGVQGAWISQNQKIKYSTELGTINTHCTNRSNWSYDAGGLIIGVNSDWCLGAGFSLMAGISGSMMYGSYHYHMKVTTDPQPAGSTTDVFSDIKNTHNRTATQARLNVGAEWSRNWQTVALKAFAGWEFNIWTNLHEFYRSSNNVTVESRKPRIWDQSDVHLQGLTMGVEFQF